MELQPWANFVARDEIGMVFQFQQMPNAGNQSWVAWNGLCDPSNFKYDQLGQDFLPAGSWKDLPWDRSLVNVERNSEGCFVNYSNPNTLWAYPMAERQGATQDCIELEPWANFVAKDVTGEVYQFKDKPNKKDEVWANWIDDDDDQSNYKFARVPSGHFVKNFLKAIHWDKSLAAVVRDSEGCVSHIELVVKPGIEAGIDPQFRTSIPGHFVNIKTAQEILIDELKAALEDARMTLRDQFAMAAPDVPCGFEWVDGETDAVQMIVRWRYLYADHMLEARKNVGAA